MDSVKALSGDFAAEAAGGMATEFYNIGMSVLGRDV